MHKLLIISVILVLALSGCSVEISPSPTEVPQIINTPEQAPKIAPSATIVNIPITGTAEQDPNFTPIPTTGKVPITWADLNLTGTLIYTALEITGPTVYILSLDLATGEFRVIIQFPVGGWSDAAVVSPDHKTLILAYSPPRSESYGGQESLYAFPLVGSGPLQLVIIPPSGADQYSQPVWSPDGKYIYFAHINYATMETYEIMRMTYPDGTPEKLIDHAYWPRVSQDGSHLVYVSLAAGPGNNQLFLANADGSEAHQVPLKGLPVPQIIDVPMTSPDNQIILFSSPDRLSASEPNWMNQLLGVQVALADGTLASDWWSVPITGGTVTQLTNLQLLALYGVYSPDKGYVGSYSADGIFVMKPDGTEVTRVVNDVGGITGTVSWLP
jgi:Tol biopolymer transport system component